MLSRKKNRKLVKKSEIITYQQKTFENPNNVDMKSVIIEHPKTSHKLSKTIRKDKFFFFEKFLNEKNIKTAKREHVFKDYASTYNVEILNSFNPELQINNTESAIKAKVI